MHESLWESANTNDFTKLHRPPLLTISVEEKKAEKIYSVGVSELSKDGGK
jgi:hypothetical protein